jgi:hypothetical protein
MRGHATYAVIRVKLHHLDRFAALHRPVVQRHRVDARERGERFEMQLGERLQRAPELIAQRCEAADRSGRGAGPGREWRHEHKVLAVVRDDPIEVPGVPGFDPLTRKRVGYEFAEWRFLVNWVHVCNPPA